MSSRVQSTALAWLAILIMGTALRAAAASGRGLWIDESFTYEVVMSGPRAAGSLMLRQDYAPPLWSVICWLAVLPLRALGVGVEGISAAIRVLAVAMFPATVAVLVLSARRGLFRESAALITAFLLAISPVIVRTGSDARMYAFCVPLTVLAGVAVKHAADRPHPNASRAVGATSLTLALSHYYGMFVAVGCFLWLIIVGGRGEGIRANLRRNRSAIRAAATAIGLVVPLFLWHTNRQFALRGTAHILPARYLPAEWLHWVGVGLAPIWVALVLGLLLSRSRFPTAIDPGVFSAAVLLVAISPTFFEPDGRHALNPGFATVFGTCLALHAGHRLSLMPRSRLLPTAVTALAVAVIPLAGVTTNITSMGRRAGLDLAAFANTVTADAQKADHGEPPVVWIHEWSWGDRYTEDLIRADLRTTPRIEKLNTDDSSLGRMTGTPKVSPADVVSRLRASGPAAAHINAATLMYFISRGNLARDTVATGLSGCGFTVTQLEPGAVRAERALPLPCR